MMEEVGSVRLEEKGNLKLALRALQGPLTVSLQATHNSRNAAFQYICDLVEITARALPRGTLAQSSDPKRGEGLGRKQGQPGTRCGSVGDECHSSPWPSVRAGVELSCLAMERKENGEEELI